MRACVWSVLLSLGCWGVGCTEPAPTDAGVRDGAAADAALDAGGGEGRPPCSPDAGDRDGGVANGITNACTGAVVLSGFGLRHAEQARRVARFAVHPSFVDHAPDGCSAAAASRGVSLVADVGGAGRARATYHVVEPGEDAWPVVRGRVEVDLVQAEQARGAELVNLEAAGLDEAPAVAVVLDGFEVDTDIGQGPDYPADYDEANGYTVRGWGAAIEGVSRDGVDLRFDAVARVALGRGDDPAMNRALGVARIRAVVHYLVVGLAAAPATGTVAYREDHRGHGEAELEICRPEPSSTELTIAGADLPRAAPALTRFGFALFPDQAFEGDRVRELSIQVDGFEWDAASQRARMHVEGYVSNAGPPAPRHPLSYELEAEVALLQWEGTGAVTSLRFEAPIAPGRNAIELPLTAR